MKDQTISKINQLGKVSRIILVIMKVFLIIGIIGCITGIIALLAMPKTNVITADGDVSAQLRINSSVFPSYIGKNNSIISESIREDDIDFGTFGKEFKWNVDASTTEDGIVFNINGVLDSENRCPFVKNIVYIIVKSGLFCAVMFITAVFGGKLAKTFETCISPFEENILISMKKFAFSLIPTGIVSILYYGTSSLAIVFVVIVVILFTYIFSYGAELQKESDETL
ncbi:MAG: hypothetical protein K2I00_01670 [Ruminococcus sp.]|nr:hypothetical protein [Ruminococcus sp.]